MAVKNSDLTEAIFAGTSDAILLLDGHRQIHSMNPAAERLLGRPAAAVVMAETCEACLDCRGPSGEKVNVDHHCPCLEAGRTHTARPYFELRVLDAAGEYRTMAVSASPVAVDGDTLIAVVFRDLSQRLDLERMLEQNARDLAVGEERRRLASEIHDSLAQSLAIIHSRVRQLHEQVKSGSPAQLAASVQALERVVQQAHGEVRQAIFDLKIPIGHGPAFVMGLREYLDEFELQSGLAIAARLPDEDPRLPLQTEVQVFRILQEALNNARKHSGAARVQMHLLPGGDGLWHLRVADSGRGFDIRRTATNRQYGLKIMQERAKAIGGLLTVTSAPGQGTQVELEFPTGWK